MTVHEAADRLAKFEDENMVIAINIATPELVRQYAASLDTELSDDEVTEVLEYMQGSFDNVITKPAWINEWMLIDAIERVKGVEL